MPSRSLASPSPTPGEMLEAAGATTSLQSLVVRAMRDHARNRVQGQAIVAGAPTTPSTQATGNAGATVLNVNLAAFKVTVNGQQKEFAAEADRALHATTVYTGADAGAGSSTLTATNHLAKITIVATSSSATLGAGTITLVNCKGATHATAAVECTDAEIQAKVGATLPWVKVAIVDVDRTGDTTVATTYDHTCQPCLAINQDQPFFTGW